MKSLILLLATITIISCKSESNHIEPDKKTQTYTYLKDTISISGKTILVLRPDSLRFQSYIDSGKEWIYEVYSDFGFGVSIALDSLNLDDVIENIIEKRYINTTDCSKCLMLIDRDTIEYGFILTKPYSEIKIDNNVFFSRILS